MVEVREKVELMRTQICEVHSVNNYGDQQQGCPGPVIFNFCSAGPGQLRPAIVRNSDSEWHALCQALISIINILPSDPV